MKKLFALLLAAAILCGCCLAAQNEDYGELAHQAAEGMRQLAGCGRALLSDQEAMPAGTSVCDWAAFAFALAGEKDDYGAYGKALEQYVTQAYADQGGLDTVKATQWHQVALTVLALGGDPRAFGTDTNGEPIDLIADGTYAYAGQALGQQGLNGWIFALITLDAKNYETPEGCRYTRQDILDAILGAQDDDGGFGLEQGASDVDITAMALQALAPYAGNQAAQAVERALEYLSAQQAPDGAFINYGQENAESTAQVVIALCALGADTQGDTRFVKNGQNAVDGLLRFRRTDGTFVHQMSDTSGDFIATEQAMIALLALNKESGGGGSIYDLTGYNPPAAYSGKTFIIIGLGAAAIAAAVYIVVVKRRKHG